MPYATAKRITENYVNSFPVDPVAIARAEGILVIPQVAPEFSGRAYIDHNRQKVIEYNKTEADVRQRFTIAHELGHHLLGHTQNGQQFRDTPSNFSTSASSYERDANLFAAELLVPTDALRFAVINKGIKSSLELAKMFNVSRAVMDIRLRSLGYIHG